MGYKTTTSEPVRLVRADINELRDQGITYEQIAERYGVSQATVHRFIGLNKAEMVVKPRSRRKSKALTADAEKKSAASQRAMKAWATRRQEAAKAQEQHPNHLIADFAARMREHGISYLCVEVQGDSFEYQVRQMESGQGLLT